MAYKIQSIVHTLFSNADAEMLPTFTKSMQQTYMQQSDAVELNKIPQSDKNHTKRGIKTDRKLNTDTKMKVNNI